MQEKIFIKHDGMPLHQGKFEVIKKSEEINNFFQLPYEKQLIEYFTKRSIQDHSNTTVRYENIDKFASLERIEYFVMFSGKAFFLKQKKAGKFLYDKMKRKIIYNNYDRHALLMDLCMLPQFDWLKHGNEQLRMHHTILSGAVVRDILIGKLTNCEDIVKQYIKSLHVKNVNWKIFVKYLHGTYLNISIKWLDMVSTDINATMEILSGCDHHKKLEIKDMINQSLSLNRKFNPRWSDKRMEEEHLKMTRELMKEEINEKVNTPIYNNCPQFEYPCKILNSEQEVYQEGLEMHHCIYTCYWSRIRDKRYIGLSFTYPERFTLGLTVTDKGVAYDQAYLKYDKHISDVSKQMVDKFLSDTKVICLLNQLLCDHKNIRHTGKVEYSVNAENMEVMDNEEDWARNIL